MINGYEILTSQKAQDDLLNYHKMGALRGIYLGFAPLHHHYTMSLPGVTDFTGFPACFTKDQLIVTERGNVAISEIIKGDRVLCFNHETKENEYRFVVNTLIHQTNDKIYKIKMRDGTVIKVTENHLFWTGTSYVKIKDLLSTIENNKNGNI